MKHGDLKKFTGVLLLVAFGFGAAAQKDSTQFSKGWQYVPAYRTLAQAGLLTGASGRDVAAQAIAGMQYQRWFTGLGVGLDYYYLRSVPVFIDARKTFSKPHIPFLYADVGCNLPWIKTQRDVWTAQHYTSGVYYDLGAGWDFRIKRRNAFLVSAGYCGKKLTNVQTTPNDKTAVAYNLRRVAIKVGFQF